MYLDMDAAERARNTETILIELMFGKLRLANETRGREFENIHQWYIKELEDELLMLDPSFNKDIGRTAEEMESLAMRFIRRECFWRDPSLPYCP